MNKTSLNIIIALFIVASVYSQNSGRGIKYQGLARYADGELRIGQLLALRVSFALQSEDSTQFVYRETHKVNSDTYGTFAMVIGDGTKDVNSRFDFDQLSFLQNYWLKIEIFENGSYREISIQKMLSTPYAENVVPVGTIMPLVGTKVPEGWLPCDGSAHGVSDYPTLAKVLADHWGYGNDSRFFIVPDFSKNGMLRGAFQDGYTSPGDVPQPLGNGTYYEAGAIQNPSIKKHKHYLFVGERRAFNGDYYKERVQASGAVASEWEAQNDPINNGLQSYKIMASYYYGEYSGLMDKLNYYPTPVSNEDIIFRSIQVLYIIKAK